VNAFYCISEDFHGVEKEFALGGTSMSYSLSITAAGWVRNIELEYEIGKTIIFNFYFLFLSSPRLEWRCF
jgi:hypothetical protein